jgi:hypothetical protein
MMKLEYAGAEVFVSDALCHALMDFSATIARIGGSEDLTIPVITSEGVSGMAEIVVGPASQLLATPTNETPGNRRDGDLHDEEAVEEIRSRAASLQHPPPATSFDAIIAGDEYDDLLEETP